MKNIKFFFFLMIGIFIFQWVYNFFAGPESINIIVEGKFKILLIVIAHVPTLVFDSLAWQILISKGKLNLYKVFLITWIAQTSGKFMPTGNVTGEFVRFFLAKQSGQNATEASSTVLIDLLIATFSLCIIGIFSFIYISLNFTEVLLVKDIIFFIFGLLLILLACTLFIIIIRRRIISLFVKAVSKRFSLRINNKKIKALYNLDAALYELSFNKKNLIKALFYRLLGWVSGALEIYVFLWIIGIDAKLSDVILIETFTAIIRSLAFFIPAGIGVQEFAFVIIGEFLGFSGIISFSVAIGRRLREILVGVPAIFAWIIFFRDKIKAH